MRIDEDWLSAIERATLETQPFQEVIIAAAQPDAPPDPDNPDAPDADPAPSIMSKEAFVNDHWPGLHAGFDMGVCMASRLRTDTEKVAKTREGKAAGAIIYDKASRYPFIANLILTENGLRDAVVFIAYGNAMYKELLRADAELHNPAEPANPERTH